VPTGAPSQLAALRVSVPVMILWTSEVRRAAAFASPPPALRVAPEGLGWFVRHVPIHPALATAVQAACVFSALAAIVGVRARLALAVLTLTASYLFALGDLSGAVWHDMHLLWLSALLAASPCDDVLAYDARHRRAPAPAARYGRPLTFARILLGAVYFFPGVHKLATSGLAWALSDNLRNQLYWKWAEHGIVPSLRVDHAPLLLHASGLFVLAFELSFPVLALVRPARPWAAAMGVVFHVLTAYLFRISFVSLCAAYVVLVDPCPWIARVRRRLRPAIDAEPAVPARRGGGGAWVTVIGAALVLGAVVQGVRGQMRSFPFACDPTFEWIVGTEMPDLRVTAIDAGGEERDVPLGRASSGYRTQRQWGEIFSLAGMWEPVDPDRLRAWVADAAVREPAARRALLGASRVRIYRDMISVIPEDRGARVAESLLVELAPLG
jgi:hypothetical protein